MKKGGVLAMTSEAYQYLGENVKGILLLFLQGAILTFLYGFLMFKVGLFESKSQSEMTLSHALLLLLASFGYIFAFVPYCINISRSILLKQKLSWNYVGSFFSWRALKMILYSIGIGVIFMIPLFLMMLVGMTAVAASLTAGSEGTALLGVGSLLLGGLVLLYFYLRLAVFGALISIDKKSVLGLSMKITKGKVMKLLMVLFLSSLPLVAVELLRHGLDMIMETQVVGLSWTLQGIVIALTMLVSMFPIIAIAIFVREQGKATLK